MVGLKHKASLARLAAAALIASTLPALAQAQSASSPAAAVSAADERDAANCKLSVVFRGCPDSSARRNPPAPSAKDAAAARAAQKARFDASLENLRALIDFQTANPDVVIVRGHEDTPLYRPVIVQFARELQDDPRRDCLHGNLFGPLQQADLYGLVSDAMQGRPCK